MTEIAQNQRLSEIRERLMRESQVTIRELAAEFSVSTMTIRRDLERLEAQGVLVRTFRGAMAAPGAAESASVPGMEPVSPVKQAIGRRAVSLVQPGQTILVDAGTTTLEVVRCLPRHSGISLVTNSLDAVNLLRSAGLRILLLGGYLSTDEVRLYGPLTEDSLAGLHADLLFVGCVGACSRTGFYMSDLYLTSNVRAMIAAAGRVVVVAESAKFTRRSLSCYALPHEVQTVVTDDGLPEDDRSALREAGIEVICVPVFE